MQESTKPGYYGGSTSRIRNRFRFDATTVVDDVAGRERRKRVRILDLEPP